jgi:hypothetical protein
MKPVLKWGEECCCQTGKGNPRPQLWGVYWVDYVCPVHGRQQHYDTYDGGTSK